MVFKIKKKESRICLFKHISLIVHDEQELGLGLEGA
jgi:hypothetical protein